MEKAEAYAKLWLQPDVEFAESNGFRSKQKSAIEAIVKEQQETFLEAWDAFFEDSK